MAKGVHTMRGLVRRWRHLANTIEEIPSAGPMDRGVVLGLRSASDDLLILIRENRDKENNPNK